MKNLAISLSLLAASSPIALSQEGAEAPLVPVPLSAVECEEVNEVPLGLQTPLWVSWLGRLGWR
jgi:hypothetical protein